MSNFTTDGFKAFVLENDTNIEAISTYAANLSSQLAIDESELGSHLGFTMYCGIQSLTERFGFYSEEDLLSDIGDLMAETGATHHQANDAIFAASECPASGAGFYDGGFTVTNLAVAEKHLAKN